MQRLGVRRGDVAWRAAEVELVEVGREHAVAAAYEAGRPLDDDYGRVDQLPCHPALHCRILAPAVGIGRDGRVGCRASVVGDSLGFGLSLACLFDVFQMYIYDNGYLCRCVSRFNAYSNLLRVDLAYDCEPRSKFEISDALRRDIIRDVTFDHSVCHNHPRTSGQLSRTLWVWGVYSEGTYSVFHALRILSGGDYKGLYAADDRTYLR